MVKIDKQDFTNDQLLEIENGTKAGLDVSVYAKKEFLAIQMHQIRLGMEKGLAIEKYASPKYDWFQMEEIRKGLLGGLNVDLYAFPEISYDRMHQIRLGLCDNIDLMPYRKLNAGILKELRKAILNKVNIVPYITAGYDKEQLEAIRTALEKGLELEPYLKKEYRGVSIQEICLGLEAGLDVSVYADVNYYWQQMRELRLGLEHMLDVQQYKNPYYSWQQMREIRLGLEEGLDVSYYRSLRYTASEMEKRRLVLQANPSIAFYDTAHHQMESSDTEHCHINIMPDEMEAYMEIKGNVRETTRTEILKALREAGIVYNILYEVIDEVVNGNTFRKPVLIAQGKPAKDGEDGWYEYFFRTKIARTPKQLEHGNVDYRSVEWFETVEKDQKIAYYHSATQGEHGISVTGKSIPARKGKEQSILMGSGFKRLPDGKTYVATKQGIITIHDYKLEISSLLVMDEVNLTTGDVNFDGNVCIQGNVSGGTKIKATQDIFVKGFVESSEIDCGGCAVLSQGMNASGSGFIRAGKDVIGCFFEATEIYAGGNIQADYFLNCRLYSEGKINITGKKGTFAGGSAIAEKGLRAYNLGNQAGIPTYIRLGIVERVAMKEKTLDESIQAVNKELQTLGSAHYEFQRKYPPEVRNTMDIYLKIESAIYTKEKQMEDLLIEKMRLEEEKKAADHISAVVDLHLYEGVTFELDGTIWKSKNLKGVTIKKKGNKIAVYSN